MRGRQASRLGDEQEANNLWQFLAQAEVWQSQCGGLSMGPTVGSRCGGIDRCDDEARGGGSTRGVGLGGCYRCEGGPCEENQSLSTIQHHYAIIQHLCVIPWLKKTNAHHHSNHALAPYHAPHSRDTSPDPGVASCTKGGAGGSTALVQLSHGALIPRYQVSTKHSTTRYQI